MSRTPRPARRRPLFPRRQGQREDGVTLVEFALVALPFFSLLFCTLEVGLMLASESVLQNAVQDAARLIRTGQSTTANTTVAQFRTAICSRAPALLRRCPNLLTVYVGNAATFSALTIPALNGVTNNFQPGAGGRAVVVLAAYDWTLSSPLTSVFSNMPSGTVRRLQGISVFRNEPF